MRESPAEILRRSVAQLNTSPSPRRDAELLLMHVTGLTRAQLVIHDRVSLTPDQHETLSDLLARRARGEPVAYLTGRREFWSMDLKITPDVLIPRPETELLVEHALARIPDSATWTIADLGTGSGAIALALAGERPSCQIIATDRSLAALAVARANATRLARRNVEFRPGDWLSPLAGKHVDMLVSNPPYVADGDPHLDRDDLRYEPRAALVSGPDGLEAIRRIAIQAGNVLRPGGWLLLEHGYDQGAVVEDILRAAGYLGIDRYIDLAGHERLTVCTAP